MGYDVDIENIHFYFTYNHSKIFQKYDWSPKSCNGLGWKKVKDKLVDVINKMKEDTDDICSPNASIHWKYQESQMYEEKISVVLGILIEVVVVLCKYQPYGVWKSD